MTTLTVTNNSGVLFPNRVIATWVLQSYEVINSKQALLKFNLKLVVCVCGDPLTSV